MSAVGTKVWDPGSNISLYEVPCSYPRILRRFSLYDSLSKILQVISLYTLLRNTLSMLISYKDFLRKLILEDKQELKEQIVRNHPLVKELNRQFLEEYTDQHLTTNKKTESFVCIRKKDPYHEHDELISKHMHWEIVKPKKYLLYEWKVLMVKNTIMSMIKKEKTRQDYETLFQISIFLLHILNNEASWHQTCVLWNQEELTCLLFDSLSMLPKRIFDQVFKVYLEQVEMRTLTANVLVKSDIVSKYLHSVKTDLLFKLCLCRRLINEGYADDNIVRRCINNFYKEKCEENKAEFTVQIFSIADSSEKSLLKLLLYCLRKKVTPKATTEHVNERCEYHKKFKSAHNKGKQDLIYAHCASILIGNKMKNVDIKQYVRKLNIKGPEDENEVEMQSQQVNLLILLILLLLVTTLGHKSAKLKKYLALKYEYDMASLYLLWCSGDIEVHPGPQWRTKQLEHDSERKRKWLQDINSILLKLYWEIPTQSKPKTLWKRKPEHWPSDKPFYDTKNTSKVDKGNKITDDKILTCLLECLKKKEIDIPQIYQSELSAWTNKNTKNIPLLHKLQVYRIEMEKIKSALLNLILSNLEDDAKSLQNINVSLKNSTLNKMQIEGLLDNDRRQKKQAETVAEITRELASILCRQARGPDYKKKDGIWGQPPPAYWPKAVSFFDPNNRGKNKDKHKCSDKVLVLTFLNLQDLKIPQNLEQLVDAYQTMYKTTKTEEEKKNKDELCRLYSIQSNLAKLDCSLDNLYKEGIFSREVHAILNQWWKTQSDDEHAEHVLKNTIVRSDERPHIKIDITKGYEPDADLKYISYTIPIKDVYLHIQCTTDHSDESSQEQTITGSLITVKSPENIEERVIPPDVIDFELEYDFVNQTKCLNDNSITDNRPMPFDFQRQETPLPFRYQHLTPHNDLDTLTTQNTLASDLNGSRRTTEYVTSVQACNSEYNSSGSTGENLVGNMGTSTVKRKQLEDKEEPVKKLMKTKANQLGHYNSTDEEISSPESKNDGGFQEPNHISTSNQHDICSANIQDLPSLEFSLSDIIDNIGDNCNSKSSEDSESLQQICDLESINSSNQQDSHENIDELKNNDNQMHHTAEHQECLEMIKSLYR